MLSYRGFETARLPDSETARLPDRKTEREGDKETVPPSLEKSYGGRGQTEIKIKHKSC